MIMNWDGWTGKEYTKEFRYGIYPFNKEFEKASQLINIAVSVEYPLLWVLRVGQCARFCSMLQSLAENRFTLTIKNMPNYCTNELKLKGNKKDIFTLKIIIFVV